MTELERKLRDVERNSYTVGYWQGMLVGSIGVSTMVILACVAYLGGM